MYELRLICVGLTAFDISDMDVKCVLFVDKLPKGIPLNELIFAIKRIAKSADAIIVNSSLQKDQLSIEEALFIQIAYTIGTPIFGIGDSDSGGFLNTIALNKFKSFEGALDHIKSNYGG